MKVEEFKVDPRFTISDGASSPKCVSGDTFHCDPKVPKFAWKACARVYQAVTVPGIGTQDLGGRADVSPRGDPVGFVKILDAQTLAIPDRPGNNRLDSLVNILANPSVGLLFIIPGFDDTLRVNGQASLVTDPDILGSMRVNGRVPALAILVKVSEVFMHCAKAFRRSHLWDPDHFQDRSGMPSLIKIILDETTGAPDDDEMRKIDDDLEEAYKRTLY